MIPSHYKLQYSKEQISSITRTIGESIGVWAGGIYEKEKQEVLAIPILRGGIFFFADLSRQIPVSVEVLPGRTKSYNTGKNAEQLDQVRIIIEEENLQDRYILLVDDICDSGRTLKALSSYMLEHGAREVKAAVLIQRLVPSPLYIPEWKGFEFSGDDWFVGYGMEDKNRWSNLPDIYTIPPG